MIPHHAIAFVVPDVTNYDPSAHKSEGVECSLLDWPQLGIDEARTLAEQAHRTPSGAVARLMIVRTSFITHEAQNALLKLFEEPPSTARFVLIVPTDLRFLPTLQSRISFEFVKPSVAINPCWSEFVACNYAERIAKIEFATKSKDVDWQRAIKRGTIDWVTQDKCSFDNIARARVLYAVERLLTRGASNKMLLEELALSLPLESSR